MTLGPVRVMVAGVAVLLCAVEVSNSLSLPSELKAQANKQNDNKAANYLPHTISVTATLSFTAVPRSIWY